MSLRVLLWASLVTILAGATTWYATSSNLLATKDSVAQSKDERFAAYRDELMRVTRCLLGTLPQEQETSEEGREES